MPLNHQLQRRYAPVPDAPKKSPLPYKSGRGLESVHALATQGVNGLCMLLESDLELHAVDRVPSKIKSLTIGSAGFQVTVIIPHEFRTNT